MAGEAQPQAQPQPQEPATQGLASEAAASAPSGWSCFKQQVVSDFQSNYQDMQEAFKGSREQHPALQVCGKVAGVTAGVCASARLIPLHGTRLAAHSVAAAAKMPVAEQTPLPVPEAPAAEAGNDVQHFKQQVIQDFQVGRQEIQTAFGYFTGNADASESSSSEPPRIGRDVIPAIASTAAGLFWRLVYVLLNRLQYEVKQDSTVLLLSTG